MKQVVEVSTDGTIRHFKVTKNTKVLHNPDGPALIRLENSRQIGRKVWYIDGKRHRTDGPAIEWDDGDVDYVVNGKRHRLDGPAVIRYRHSYPDEHDRLHWYVNDRLYIARAEYETAVARWTSYRDVTRNEIKMIIGDFKIVEWE